VKRIATLRNVIGLSVFCAAATGVTAASAQSQSSLDSITAEALFDEGVRLMGLEDYGPACPKLQRSYELDPGIGTLLYLGDCYRAVGKTASAWMAFRAAAFAAAEAGQREREQAATAYAETLHPQLVLIRLQMLSVQPGIQLLFDGHPLHSELINVPFAVDPGEHMLELGAPGLAPQRKLVDLENKPGIVVVDLPQLQPSPPPVVERRPEPLRPQPPPKEASMRDSLGWLLLGAGASALAVGGGLAVLSDNTRTGLGVAAGGALSAGVGGLLLFRSTSGEVQLGLSAGAGGGALVAGSAF
jgi:serine/threonine-protein kinase